MNGFQSSFPSLPTSQLSGGGMEELQYYDQGEDYYSYDYLPDPYGRSEYTQQRVPEPGYPGGGLLDVIPQEFVGDYTDYDSSSSMTSDLQSYAQSPPNYMVSPQSSNPSTGLYNPQQLSQEQSYYNDAGYYPPGSDLSNTSLPSFPQLHQATPSPGTFSQQESPTILILDHPPTNPNATFTPSSSRPSESTLLSKSKETAGFSSTV